MKKMSWSCPSILEQPIKCIKFTDVFGLSKCWLRYTEKKFIACAYSKLKDFKSYSNYSDWIIWHNENDTYGFYFEDTIKTIKSIKGENKEIVVLHNGDEITIEL